MKKQLIESYLANAEKDLAWAKKEPAHSPVEDNLIDCLEYILVALREMESDG